MSSWSKPHTHQIKERVNQEKLVMEILNKLSVQTMFEILDRALSEHHHGSWGSLKFVPSSWFDAVRGLDQNRVWLRKGNKPITHWGRVTHICVSKLVIVGSDNGLSPGRRQAIIWTNGGIVLIWPLWTNFSEISIDIHTFTFRKIHFKISPGKWRPFCLGLNVLANEDSALWLIYKEYKEKV